MNITEELAFVKQVILLGNYDHTAADALVDCINDAQNELIRLETENAILKDVLNIKNKGAE